MTAEEAGIRHVGLPGLLEYPLEGFVAVVGDIVGDGNLRDCLEKIFPMLWIPVSDEGHLMSELGIVGSAPKEFVQEVKNRGGDAAWPRHALLVGDRQWSHGFGPHYRVHEIWPAVRVKFDFHEGIIGGVVQRISDDPEFHLQGLDVILMRGLLGPHHRPDDRIELG